MKFKIGDRVYIKKLDEPGKVISILDGYYFVEYTTDYYEWTTEYTHREYFSEDDLDYLDE